MASYDLKTLTGVECAQFTGSAQSILDVQAICRDARADPTEQRTMTVPVGSSHGTVRRAYVNDWVTKVATGEFLVLPDASFQALFTPTP